MKTVILLLLVSLSACSTKAVYIEPKPYDFQLTKPVPQVTVRVHPQDADVYSQFIDALRKQSEFHNQQIKDYLERFKK